MQLVFKQAYLRTLYFDQTTDKKHWFQPDVVKKYIKVVNILKNAKVVEDEKAYLDNHLTLNSLSRKCGMNRTYVSAVLTERLGGFFSYVNQCRLAHVEAYKVTHPRADLEEARSVASLTLFITVVAMKADIRPIIAWIFRSHGNSPSVVGNVGTAS